MAKVLLYKTIFEVRYPSKLEFFNVFIAAAQAFDGYPDWEVSSLAVSLRNFEKRCSLNIQHNRFVYDQDSDDPSVTDKDIKEALEKLVLSLIFLDGLHPARQTRA